jgi:hypothetical protein
VLQVPLEVSHRIEELWGKGVSRAMIARATGFGNDRVNAEIRRLIAIGQIAERTEATTVIRGLPLDEMPPPKPPLRLAAALEDYRQQAAARGGAKAATGAGGRLAAPVDAPAAAGVIDWVIGATGLPTFPEPAGFAPGVPLGGVGEIPEPRHHGFCQWVITPARQAPNGWRGIVFCREAAIRGGAYCPGHHGMAFIPRPAYGQITTGSN